MFVLTSNSFQSNVVLTSTREIINHPINYVHRHKLYSSKNSQITLFYENKRLFEFQVNQHLFNPIDSLTSQKLSELILSRVVVVKGKKVIDLGCGSGIIGFTAIHMGASKTLFSDINRHIEGIQQNFIFRDCDELVVQDILKETGDNTYDVVLNIPPAIEAIQHKKINYESFEAGVFRDRNFYKRVFFDTGRVLVPGGQLVIWTQSPSANFLPIARLISESSDHFDTSSIRLLAWGLEKNIIMGQQASFLNRHLTKFLFRKSRNTYWQVISVYKK